MEKGNHVAKNNSDNSLQFWRGKTTAFRRYGDGLIHGLISNAIGCIFTPLRASGESCTNESNQVAL